MGGHDKEHCNNIKNKINLPENKLKLMNSASDQNIFFTYVCLINDLKATDTIYNKGHKKSSLNLMNEEAEETNQEELPIQVERSKALHELIEFHRKDDTDVEKEHNEADSSTTYPSTTFGDDSELSETEDANIQNSISPNILKLTKMKWLTEEQEGSPDSSSPLLSPTNSSTSTNGSRESDDGIDQRVSVNNKYLSTILRLDREHNMFGLSNITIVKSRPSRKMRKIDEKPVFHQTAIVQICCGKKCCKHRSKTDLPASLKCGGCRGCRIEPSHIYGAETCTPSTPCPPVKCTVDCTTCFGMKISLNRKPKFEPSPVELTPRSSCILQKPIAARSCHHLPQCIPPSSCFPYLMPCFWPARAGAPCNTPARCFHNPPCRLPRTPQIPLPLEETCPPKCEDKAAKTKCQNQSCPGNNPTMEKEIETRFGKK
ncbi:uncharacterized protein LOC116413436 isoform X2 [Galleria mellonella]|uniref:Uncharacterized protein LOC116413436 isoform X2 n=1 Tax=Galleria mellonella TaxID=7137 RepID=A0ABM3MGD9_GALME|nr:uncharacterized protein LOC116413436 isoform X2 [Galleria mellonella]